MSGLGELGELPGFTIANVGRVQQRDIDQYIVDYVIHPSVDTAYMATVSSATASALFVNKSFTPDYPRNLAYAVTGVAGGMGGTFVQPGFDQFGSVIKETVTIGSANGGGTTQGTQIFGSIGVGTFSPAGLGGTAVGTAKIGFGTATGAPSGGGNWFGLQSRIGGTADVRGITWINNGTATALNKGTNLGTLSNVGGTLPPHSFQGTSGVAITDEYVVTIKTTFDNLGKGEMTSL